jgi:hypothetical protein
MKGKKMKTVEYYTGTSCVQLCTMGLCDLLGLDSLNREAKRLQTEARRICKFAGIWNEFTDLSISLVMSERKMFVAFCESKEICKKIVDEAQKRHFALTKGIGAFDN